MSMNLFCKIALEEALRIKEAGLAKEFGGHCSRKRGLKTDDCGKKKGLTAAASGHGEVGATVGLKKEQRS
ncbi:Electron transfer flavoprotein subunit beta [Corchorus olitorius]|uniref:Electron transfer flavoprotein subunit beta n=1 Tax=Corchorus olitorius TaxID=93759 RepID=A0A1R3I6W1_9ROSI|nr:Electron transfer flavoprotein subunit beta [Corchorus olitorius]